MIVSNFKKIRKLLSKSERIKVYLLLLPMTVTALMNIVGVAFIVPFIAVAADPTAIFRHKKLALLYHYLHFTSIHYFLLFLGVVVLAALVILNTFSAINTWLTVRVTSDALASVSYRLLHYYLYQPYAFFLDNNTSELNTNIFQLVGQVINSGLQAGMNLIASSLVILLIFCLLLIVSPWLAVATAIIIGGAYTLIYVFSRKKLVKISRETVSDENNSYKIASEAFGGIKDIKLFRNEHWFLSRFWQPQKGIASNRAALQTIQQLPRYGLEIIAFGGVLILVIYSLALNHNFSSVIPLLALYVFAGYRLMPAIQQIFTQLTSIKSSTTALDTLFNCLNGYDMKVSSSIPDYVKPLPFLHTLTLKNLSFKYSQSKRFAINNLSLTIKANTTTGFVGRTGSGKTTIVDIILGLLTSQEGHIYVDSCIVSSANCVRWQKNLGYVPQHIYLCDDTITRNIAFGLPDELIDHEAVQRAAQAAAIHDFITLGLPKGYDTCIGERGIRLSGGQRQRIGIARALYHNPSVLILDEATSALDGSTETAIMDAIHNLAHKKTIIIIAHRLTTVTKCDTVFLVEDGAIQDYGLFAELTERNTNLREMARLT